MGQRTGESDNQEEQQRKKQKIVELKKIYILVETKRMKKKREIITIKGNQRKNKYKEETERIIIKIEQLLTIEGKW